MLNKAATSLSLLFAVLLLLSLPGESSESNANNARWGKTPRGLSLTPANTPANPDTNTPTAGFSYSQWLSAGQPLADENWASGTFVFRPTAAETYQSRLSAAWRDAAARAWDVQPLLRDELLLRANSKASNWQAAWQNHREAALLGLVDGTTDALLDGILADGRSLSWVRRLDVDFRTKLGNRPGSFGVDAIIALKEAEDRATGLQLRGFFGNNLKGANAGLFYRQANGNNLLGGNIFLDYENTDKGGDFWRWSVGGEWRSPYVELTGNRYIGITERQRGSDGLYHYTADGTEIELALKSPKAPWLSGILSYYQWDGEYGDADDTGFRYGIRVDRRLGGLSFELEYEDPEKGDSAWGGRVNYSHDFGKGAESASTPEALTFDPRAHFFDSVRREYTQRIRKTGNVLTGRIIITRVNGRATLIGSELSLQIAGDGQNFTTALALISPTVNGGITTTVTGAITTQTVTDPNDYTITATALVTAFTQSPATLGLSVNNWAIELHSQLAFLHDSPTMTLIEGQLEVQRNNNNGISEIVLTNGITLKLTNNALISVSTGPTVSLVLTSGIASLVLNAGNTLDAMVGDGTLIVSVAANAGVAASVGSIAGGEIILISSGVTQNIVPLVSSLSNSSVVVTTGYTGLVAQITTTGGSNNRGYSVVLGSGTFTVGATDGRLSLFLAQSNPATLTALVQASDTGTLGARATPVTVGYTLLVGEHLRFSPDKSGVTITTYDNNRPLLTASASAAGQLSVLSYALISTAPAGFAANFAVLPDSGIISLQQAVTAATTLSVYIRASEQLGGGVSRAATLLLTVAAPDPQTFAATLDNTAPVLITGNSGLVAQISSTGGKGTYTYTFQSGGGDFAVGTDGRISLRVARADPTTLAAIIIANDGHPNTPAVRLSLTLSILDALGFTPNRISLRLTTYDTTPVALLTVTAVDPLGGAITYALISTAPAGFTSIDFTPANRVVSLTAELTTPLEVSIYIRATTATEQATLILQLEAVNPPAINAAFVNASSAFLTGETGLLASVSVTGGQGAYTYTVSNASQFTVGTDGLITLTPAQSSPTTLTATVIVNDGHANTAPLSLSLTLTLVKPVSFSPDKSGVTLTTHDSVPVTLHQANLLDGLGTPAYAVVSTAPSNFTANILVNSGNGRVILNQQISSPITASVYVRGAAATFGGAATLLLTVIALDPPAFAAALDNTAAVLITGNSGLVAQVNSTGGKGTYTYTFQSGGSDFTVGTDGRISLRVARADPITLAAVIIADDGHPNTPPVTLNLTLRILNVLNFTPSKISLRLTTYDTTPVALLTVTAVDPLSGTIIYSLLSTSPAGFASIDFTPANRVISLTAELTTTVDVSVYILATTATEQATLTVQLEAVNPPAINAAFVNASSAFLTGETGLLASVSVTGGQGAYTYTVSNASQFTVGTDGLLTLTPAQSSPTTLTATVVVNDGHANTAPVSLSLALTIVQPVSFSPDKSGVTLTTHDSVPVSLHQANLLGGLGTPAYALVSTDPVAFSVNISIDSGSGQITLTQLLSSPITASVYVRGAAATFGGAATLLLTVIALAPPAFAAALDNTAPILITGGSGLVAQVNSTGGKGTYTYTIQPAGGNLTIGTNGSITLLTAVATPATLTATVVADDGHPNTPPVTLSLTLEIVNALRFTPSSKISLRLTTHGTVPVALLTVTAVDPLSGAITYSLLSTAPASFSSVDFTPANQIISLTAELTAPFDVSLYILATTATEKATLTLQLKAVEPPAFAAALDSTSPAIVTGNIGLVAQVNATGGAGTYTYTIQPADGNLTIGTNGGITLLTAIATPATAALSATIVANDGHPNTPPVTLSLTLAVLTQPAFANAYTKVVTSHTGAVASITAPSNSQFSVVVGDTNFAVGASDGILSLKTAVTTASTLTANVLVSDSSSSPIITLGYTLNIGPCSFLTGCQPLVNYNGATHGVRNNPGDPIRRDWESISATVAQSLIAAGADPNERIAGDEPLFAATRYAGTPALISVLLTAGADATAVGVINGVGGSDIYEEGIFHYIEFSRNSGFANELVSLFVAASANVNLQRVFNGTFGYTPLDSFSDYAPLNNTILIAAGGKCIHRCLTGFITLTAVSFSPTVVTESAAVVNAGNIYTVQAASGLGNSFNYRLLSIFPVSVSSRLSAVSLDVNRTALSLSSLNDFNGLTISVYVEVDDQLSAASQGKATLQYVFNAKDAIRFEPSVIQITEVLDANFAFAVHNLAITANQVTGPAVGSVTYSLLSVNASTAASLTGTNDAYGWDPRPFSAQTLSVLFKAEDTANNAATLLLSIAVQNPPPLVVSFADARRALTATYTGPVAAIITTGGGGNGGNGGTTRYSVLAFGGDNFTVGTDGILSLTAVHNSAVTLTASVVVDNSYQFVDVVPTVTVGYTLTAGLAPPALVNALGRAVFFYTGTVASITNALPGGFSLSFGGDNFTVAANGELTLKTAITSPTNLTASIVVNVPLTTLGYTLSVGACSFFIPGCQPLVNYVGVTAGASGNAHRAAWAAITSPLAQSLIAASVNVNEVSSIEDDTPLLAIARYGRLAVAEVLLTAGANVNAVAKVLEVSGGATITYSNIGVLDYVIRNNDNNSANLVPLVTLFVAHDVDVNKRTETDNVPTITPLDRFNSRTVIAAASTAAIIIRAAGGKCTTICETINGVVDVSLAALSFISPSVTVTAFRTAAAALHTVRAATGLGNQFVYQVASTNPAGLSSNFSVLSVDVNSAILSLNASLGFGQTISIFIAADDRLADASSAAKATLLYVQIIPPTPALVNASLFVLTAYTGAVASVTNALSSSGLTVVLGGNQFTVGTNGELTLTAAQNSPATLTASVQVTDGGVMVTLGYTLTVVENLRFSPDKLAATLITYDNNLLLLTASASALGHLNAPAYALVSANPLSLTANFTVSSADGIVSAKQTLTTATTLSLYIGATEVINGINRAATLLLTVVVADPPVFAAALDNSSPAILTASDNNGLVAQVNSTGGKGTYTYTIQPADGNLTIGTDGRITLLTAVATPATLTATLVADDDHSNTTPVTLGLTLRILDVLGFAPSKLSLRLTTHGTVPVALLTVVATDPSGGTITYALLSTAPVGFTNSINFTPAVRVISLTATLSTTVDVSIYIIATTDTEKATLTVQLEAVNPPAIVAALDNTTPAIVVGNANAGLVAQINTSGGQGAYTYAIQPANGALTVGTDGLITLLTAQAAATTLSATISVNDADAHPEISPVTVSLTLAVLLAPNFVNASQAVITAYAGAVASIANAPSGVFTVIFGDNQFTVADGKLSLTAAINAASILTASVRVVLPSLLTTTLGYTLTVASCSFFSGCQPLVNFSGAPAGLGAPNSQAQWSAITELTARALIDAGANVNERVNFEYNQGAFPIGDDTPFLAATRFGSPAVVSILLAAGASVNSVGRISYTNTRRHTNIGVLDYVTNNTANVDTLVSLFIANSVDVNQRSQLESVVQDTPLDRFNRNTLTVAAGLIKAAGGKCTASCLTINGVVDVSLAALSFISPSVTVTAFRAAAAALHTVRAATGLGNQFVYQVASTNPAGLSSNFSVLSVDVNSAILSLNASLGFGQTISIFIAADDRLADASSVAKATLLYVQIIPPTPALVNASLFVLTAYTGAVASVTNALSSGFTVIFGDNQFTVGTNGELTLTAAQNTAATLTASVQVTDGGATLVALGYTLTVVENLRFSPDKLAATLITYDNNLLLLTASASALGNLNAPAYALVSANPAGLTANFTVFSADGIVSVQQSLTTPATISLYIGATEGINGINRAATLLLTVVAADPPTFAAALDDETPGILTGNTGFVTKVNSTGGKGTYTYAIQPADGNLTIGTNGSITLLTAVSTPTTLSATVVANDGHPNTPPVTLSLTLRILNALGFTPSKISLGLTTHGTVPVALLTVVAVDPLGGTITYALLSTAPVGFTNSINFTPTSQIISLTTTLSTTVDVSIYIRATTDTEEATLTVQLEAVNPPAIVAALDNTAPVIAIGNANAGKVAQINATGGAGAYTYAIQPANGALTVGTDGLITLLTAQAAATTLSATVSINDAHPDTQAVTVSLTLAVLPGPNFVNAFERVIFSYTGSVASITSELSANFSVVSGDNNFTVGATDGILSLKTAITNASALTVSVRAVVPSSNLTITLGYTLSVGACSFFVGCLPAVNYNSSNVFRFNRPWVTSLTLAQSLIAAGADPNEVYAVQAFANSPQFGDDITTPILHVAFYGNAAVAEVLLTAGASVNVIGRGVGQSSGNVDNFGVLNRVAAGLRANILPLISLFVDMSANVNFLSTLSIGGSKIQTPFDSFIDQQNQSEAAAVVASFGGKCNSQCNTGDIRLSAVAFSPASLTATVGATVTGAIHTVQAAAGLGDLFNYRVVSTFPASFASNYTVVSLDVNRAALNISSPLGLNTRQTISIFVEAADNNSTTDKATLQYIQVIPTLSNPIVSAFERVIFSYTGSVGVIGNVLFDGAFSVVAGSDNFTVGATDGILSLKTAITSASKLTASIRVLVTSHITTTLGYILNIAPCSFFDGCLPSVNYSGVSVNNINNSDTTFPWLSNLLFLQSLIAAGAAVDEILTVTATFPESKTPVIAYMARSSSPLAVVEALLDAGANVVSVKGSEDGQSSGEYSNLGVFHYMTGLRRSAPPNSNDILLISLFAARGANVNQVGTTPIRVFRTPLDYFNNNSGFAAQASAIISFGGKCKFRCLAGNIPLAAVTFNPTSLMVTVGGAVKAALHTVQAATGEGTLFNYQVVSTFPASFVSKYTVVSIDVNRAVLSLSTALLLFDQTISIFVEVADNNSTTTTKATIQIVQVVPPLTPPNFSNAFERVIFSYTGLVASITSELTANFSVVSGDNNFTVGATDGALSLKTTITNASTLTVSVRAVVTSHLTTTLAYTLSVGQCSFFNGCQPAVNHTDGTNLNSNLNWTQNAALVASLIAATVALEEIHEQSSTGSRRTPLLWVAHLPASSLAVAEALLAANASVNAVGARDDTGGFVGDNSNVGILHILVNHGRNRNPATLFEAFVSLFVRSSANVNLIGTFGTANRQETPLDSANVVSNTDGSIIASYGGKCNIECRTGNITLASISFSPASLTVTGIANLANSANIYTVQVASGLGNSLSYIHTASEDIGGGSMANRSDKFELVPHNSGNAVILRLISQATGDLDITITATDSPSGDTAELYILLDR